jgi:hypothetical protein
MLITEKRTIMTVNTDPAEQYAIEMVDYIATGLLHMLEDNKKSTMVNLVTGEVIDAEDLKRLCGILQGISYCTAWELE